MNRSPYQQQQSQGRTRPAATSPPQQQQQPSKLPVFTVNAVHIVDTGNLLAFADLQIGRGPNAITVCSWRLIKQPEQEPWVSGPQEIYSDPASGERRYKNLFVYPKEWRQAITAAIGAAYEQHKSQSGKVVAE